MTMRFAILSLGLLAAPSLAAGPQVADPGAVVYEEVCKACHMADAKGAVGAGRITALAGNTNLAYPEYPIAVVTGGKGPMPWFRGQLTDQQIADVISYVRMHFGNKYKARVTAAQVAELGVKAPKGGRE
jgi:mono/diheme cytochrome c family protein